MTSPTPDQEPLDPDTARLVARVRRLMLISGATTGIALAIVLGVIGYRVFTGEGSSTPKSGSAVTASLPKGAKVISTAVGEGRIAVTIEVNGAVEIRTYDLKTLKQQGQLKFVNEP